MFLAYVSFVDEFKHRFFNSRLRPVRTRAINSNGNGNAIGSGSGVDSGSGGATSGYGTVMGKYSRKPSFHD